MLVYIEVLDMFDDLVNDLSFYLIMCFVFGDLQFVYNYVQFYDCIGFIDWFDFVQWWYLF